MILKTDKSTVIKLCSTNIQLSILQLSNYVVQKYKHHQTILCCSKVTILHFKIKCNEI